MQGQGQVQGVGKGQGQGQEGGDAAAYLAKLIRSMPRLSCLSPLHCLLHLAFGIPTFQSMCFHTFRVLPDIRNI